MGEQIDLLVRKLRDEGEALAARLAALPSRRGRGRSTATDRCGGSGGRVAHLVSGGSVGI